MTIDLLPDNVLLDIFDFCLNQLPDDYIFDMTSWTTVWQTLVHVCHGWRDIVFQSPRRLDLKILCTLGTHVGEILDMWPALPLIIWVCHGFREWGLQNISAALEHRDRISCISVNPNHPSSNSALEVCTLYSFPGLSRR